MPPTSAIPLKDSPGPRGNKTLADALQEFETILDDKNKAEYQKVRSVRHTANDVVTFAAALDERDSQGKRRRFSKWLEPYMAFLHRFTGIVDTAVQAKPEVAALVWASAKFMIMVAHNYTEYFEGIAEHYQTLSYLCPAFEGLAEMYPKSTELQAAVERFCIITVEFSTTTIKFLQKRKTRLIGATWKPFSAKFAIYDKAFKKGRDEIELEFRVASEKGSLWDRQRDSLFQFQGRQHWKYEIEQLSKMEKQIDTTAERSVQAIKHLLHSRKILGNITDHDYEQAYHKARSKRCEGTGIWLQNSLEYQDWLRDGTSGLWINGFAGSGKSTIVAAAMDHIYTQECRNNTVLLYYFFDFTDGESLEPITVLNSLIKQLVHLLDPDHLSLDLYLSIQRTYEKGNPGRHRFDYDTLTGHIKALCKHFTRTFIVIDGLDECSRNHRQSLLTVLGNILSPRDYIIKMLLASRPELDIKEQLSNVDFYTIILPEENDHHGQDMRHYIQSCLEPHFKDLGLLPSHEELLGDLIAKVLKEAKGMYLLAALRVDELCRTTTVGEMYGVLEDTATVTELLDRTLKHISEAPVVNQEQIIGVLEWIAAAKRAMTISELTEAIALRATDTRWSSSSTRRPRNMFKVLQGCGSLISIIPTRSGEVVQFFHPVVWDYLTRHLSESSPFRLSLDRIDQNIGRICLAYYQFPEFESQITEANSTNVRIRPSDVTHATVAAFASGSSSRRILATGLKLVGLSPRPYSFQEFDLPGFCRTDRNTVSKDFTLYPYIKSYGFLHCGHFSIDINKESEIRTKLYSVAFEEKLSSSFMGSLPWSRYHSEYGTPGKIMEWAIQNANPALAKVVLWRLSLAPLDGVTASAWILLCYESGCVEILELISKSPFYDQLPGRDCLYKAAALGHSGIVMWHLRKISSGGRPQLIADYVYESLKYATIAGQVDVVKNVVEVFRFPNNAGENSNTFDSPSLLQIAIEESQQQIMGIYLQSDADIDTSVISGGLMVSGASRRHKKPPKLLDLAIAHEVKWAFSDLLKAGAKPHQYNDKISIEMNGSRSAKIQNTAQLALVAKSSYFIEKLLKKFPAAIYGLNSDTEHTARDIFMFALDFSNAHVLQQLLDSDILRKFEKQFKLSYIVNRVLIRCQSCPDDFEVAEVVLEHSSLDHIMR